MKVSRLYQIEKNIVRIFMVSKLSLTLKRLKKDSKFLNIPEHSRVKDLYLADCEIFNAKNNLEFINFIFQSEVCFKRVYTVLSDASMRLSLDSPLKFTKSEGKSLKKFLNIFGLIEVLFGSKFNVSHFLNCDFYLANLNLEKAILCPTFGSGNYNGGKRHDVIANHAPCCIPKFITLTAKIYLV